MKRYLKRGTMIFGALLIIGAIAFHKPAIRIYKVLHFFDKENIVENFRTADQTFGKSIIKRSGPVYQLPVKIQPIGDTYMYNGKQKSIQKFLKDNWATSFIVLKNGVIIHEQYFRGNTAKTKSISWSVSKSILSAIFGIAVKEGKIDIEKNVNHYVPFLKGSGYEGVRIKDVLQMSSGIKFNEDYGDYNSDINRMGRLLALNTSIDDFVKSLKRDKKPGTYNHYVSMDTQVLGMILKNAIGQSITQYMHKKLWGPLGAESDAYWCVDNNGMELVFGALNAVARDYARFGLLYLNKGKLNGRQIVPAQWVKDSITPDAPHLMAGRKEKGKKYVPGYGYQWWIPPITDGDFVAIGIYNQYIYVNPKKRVVIVKSSAYPHYNKDGKQRSQENVIMFKKIAKSLK